MVRHLDIIFKKPRGQHKLITQTLFAGLPGTVTDTVVTVVTGVTGMEDGTVVTVGQRGTVVTEVDGIASGRLPDS